MSTATSIYNHSPVWLQNVFVSAYGYQWKKRRFGGIFPEEYIKAKERESFSAEKWQAYTNNQLRNILAHAFSKVPFYQESFKRAGITEKDVKDISVANIHGIPVLSKEDLRRFGTSSMLSVTREKGGSFFASSGSTGTPTQILFSHAMHQRWMAIFENRVRNWAGVTSNMPRGMIGGRRVLPDASNKPPFYRYNYFEKQLYFSAYHISKKNAADYLDGIKKYKLQYMTGYAMSNYLLAKCIQEEGLQAADLKAVITSSEKLTPDMRKTFLEVYNCKTFDGWSGVEACGLITECEHGSLHISPDAGLIEVLDENMQPVSAGQPGTVYCTGFLNYDQPLIRYNIGDTIILSDKTCSCGRAMPVVEEIIGRVEDVVVGKSGQQMVRFHGIFTGLKSVRQAQVIQESANHIHIKIVSSGLDQKEEEIMRQRLISQLGEMEISFETVDSIPLTANGKFKAVISKLK